MRGGWKGSKLKRWAMMKNERIKCEAEGWRVLESTRMERYEWLETENWCEWWHMRDGAREKEIIYRGGCVQLCRNCCWLKVIPVGDPNGWIVMVEPRRRIPNRFRSAGNGMRPFESKWRLRNRRREHNGFTTPIEGGQSHGLRKKRENERKIKENSQKKSWQRKMMTRWLSEFDDERKERTQWTN